MPQESPPFFALISRQLEIWGEQRAALQSQIDEIDAKLAAAAKSLGVEPDALAQAAPSKLPRRSQPEKEGTMAKFIRDTLKNAEQGITRVELKEMVRAADPRFAEMLQRNENGFYNAIKRGLQRAEIADRGGALYDFHRAPDEEDAEQVTDLTNVTLFNSKSASDV